MNSEITIGSRVRVTSDGVLHGCAGIVQPKIHHSRPHFIQVLIDDRCSWFTADELELLPPEGEKAENELLKQAIRPLKEKLYAEQDKVAALTQERDELRAACRHLFVCDMPESLDFRCDGCNAARAALAKSPAPDSKESGASLFRGG